MKIRNINISYFKNLNDANEYAFELFRRELDTLKEKNFCLATGSTPVDLYKLFVKSFNEKQTTWKNITSFNLDEYIGLEPNNKFSFRYFMDSNLFNYIDIQKENINFLSGTSNPEQEIVRYEKEMDKAGPFDITLLGVGKNGHIAFNEPGTPRESKTHIIDLTDSTIKANEIYFDNPNDMPRQGITMGIDSIISRSKKIILIAFGESKREALEALISNKVNMNYPITYLLEHNDVEVITDIKL
ncbi:MAG: glucosamine-6-phosphate deaminase [Mycoplasmataceae bacterium]|nr:glucosamine-6-phosphate deaminase [Mycoplasmataceae bacterium]